MLKWIIIEVKVPRIKYLRINSFNHFPLIRKIRRIFIIKVRNMMGGAKVERRAISSQGTYVRRSQENLEYISIKRLLIWINHQSCGPLSISQINMNISTRMTILAMGRRVSSDRLLLTRTSEGKDDIIRLISSVLICQIDQLSLTHKENTTLISSIGKISIKLSLRQTMMGRSSLKCLLSVVWMQLLFTN